jgi:hypothetical protein
MKSQTLSHLNHCSFSLNYHLVLVTKYRKKCINAPILRELKNICERLCETWECKLIEFNLSGIFATEDGLRIFVLTTKKGLKVSNDGGKTWQTLIKFTPLFTLH